MAERIPFNRPTLAGTEANYVAEVFKAHKLGTTGAFIKQSKEWLSHKTGSGMVLPTGSCTAALEISAILLDLQSGDEVIMPSFGYPSTANAIVRQGATPVFVDIEPNTLNIDPIAVEAAITSKTKAIVPIHYGGHPAEMDKICKMSAHHGLTVIEDAANAFLSTYRGQLCGTLGTFGCFSYHETKFIQCGQGGALLINNSEHEKRAEILLEKGTDRNQYTRGEVDRYTWKDVGSSFGLDNVRAAVLVAQLEASEDILADRRATWYAYHESLQHLAHNGHISLPKVSEHCSINGMIYWLLVNDTTRRDALIHFLAEHGVHSVFHYQPLHSSAAGQRFGRYHGADQYTTRVVAQIVRLPIFYGLEKTKRVVDLVSEFFEK